MSHFVGNLHGRSIGGKQVFPARSRAYFAASYPEGPHKLTHDLFRNPLLELDALAAFAESLPASSVECHRGDVPIGADGNPGPTGCGIGETIREIEKSNSWAILKNIEQDASYGALVQELVGELRDAIEPITGEMLTPRGFILVSSPEATTPYHFDPEHHVLLQLRGQKAVTVFPAGNARFAPDTVHEAYHTGGGRKLDWQESFAREGMTFQLEAGDAVYVPVMAPHFVRNGPEPSISLSITWRSRWSHDEADARAFNHWLRGHGLDPRPTGRWPRRNRLKAIAWRAARRIRGLI